MPVPYPMDFRREVVALLKSSGKTVPELAAEPAAPNIQIVRRKP